MSKKRRKDVFGFKPSKLVPFIRDEEPRARHNRRLAYNLALFDEAGGWCQEHGITLELKNEGQHWRFRYRETVIDWWPSTAKLLINRDWENGYHIYDWLQAREIVFDEKVRTDALPPKQKAVKELKPKTLKPKLKKSKSKLRVIRANNKLIFISPKKPFNLNLTSKEIADRLRGKIKKPVFRCKPKNNSLGSVKAIADRMKQVLLHRKIFLDDYAGQKCVAFDLKHNLSPMISIIVKPEVDENALRDELNAKLSELFSQYGIVHGHYPLEVELHPRTGIIPTREERIAQHDAMMEELRGTPEENEAANKKYQDMLDNHPDNGKLGYWKVEGVRHSAICKASNVAEAIDKVKEIVQSWESPTADFIGTELPEVIEL